MIMTDKKCTADKYRQEFETVKKFFFNNTHIGSTHQSLLSLQAYEQCGVKKEYLVDLLCNGFYCFEAIRERNLEDGICGICGVIGELYLGWK